MELSKIELEFELIQGISKKLTIINITKGWED